MYQYVADAAYPYDDGRYGHRHGDGPSFRGYGIVGLQYDHNQRYPDAKRYLQLQYPPDGGLRAGSGDGNHRGEREYGISGVFCADAVHPYGTDGYHARDDGRDGDWFGNGSSFGRDGGVGVQYGHN